MKSLYHVAKILFSHFGDMTKLLFNTRVQPGKLYDLMGDKLLANESQGDVPLGNVGYWKDITVTKDPKNLERANFALFDRVTDLAGIIHSDQLVVEVGSGFGILCARLMQSDNAPQKMHLYNLSSTQLNVTKKILSEHPKGDQVSLFLQPFRGDRYQRGSVNRVISVEAAFHFEKRSEYFKEAYKVLAPNGTIAMSDILFPAPKYPWTKLIVLIAARAQQFPCSNVGSLEDYKNMVKAAGFKSLKIEDVTDFTLKPFSQWFWKQPLITHLSRNLLYLLTIPAWLLIKKRYILLLASK